MMIHDITALAGAYKKRKRVGRGEGSGHGKTSGRGAKGAGSRSGTSAKKGFEGGQMRYFRRLAKFGFTNAPFKVRFWTVNLGDIISHADFAKGGDITAQTLIKAGLVRDESRDLKILGNIPKGSAGVKAKFAVKVARVSEGAKKAIEAAGGSVMQTGTRKDFTKGIDPNSADRKPTKLTKKLTRGNVAAKARALRANESKAGVKPDGKPDGKDDAKAEGKADGKAEAKASGKPEAKPAGPKGEGKPAPKA